ncbi:MAG: radical SAM protein [Candidatus Thermoplasmatota archaeon]|jgi:7-carboxy-7-deazaguanine synthase|nr:radical SAM protein [Candidatus Thermoplasmatota archaeon]
MKINEIFYSIQGEGAWSGLPNIFIRTTGCNLRCSFCDTKYAYFKGKEMSIKEIIKKITQYPCNYVCITGGEPLLQKDITDLINKLLKKRYKICVETNGSMSIEKLLKKKTLMISLDIKCPSSSMHKNNFLENINFLRKHDQLKFVIKNKNDYEYAKKILETYKPACTVFLQPVWGKNPKNLAEWIINDGLNAKLGLQIHKIIWGEKRKV